MGKQQFINILIHFENGLISGFSILSMDQMIGLKIRLFVSA